jgi:5-methyltetrahydropteroyltriglutamate--homocysteine methyltransferase
MQMTKGRPPFRADHVGSLLRPAALRQAFRAYGAGQIDDPAFAQVQDQCIRDAVRRQEALGLKVVTDGEFRRGSYWSRFAERVEGFSVKTADFKFRDDQGNEVEFTAPYTHARLRRTKPLALDEFQFLQQVTNATPKVTLPSPSTMHFFRCTDYADPAAYSSLDAFFADLAAVYRAEIVDLANAECRYIQLDEVAIAQLCDPTSRKIVEGVGQDPDRLVGLYIDALNDAITAAPSNTVVGVHMCRGNFKGHYLAAGGYESVAEQFFSQTKANHFLLEYDTQRAGDFRPLRFVKDKGVVLGLISSKSPTLENVEALEYRVREASSHIDLEQLAISPQCGFASTVAGNPVTEEIEYEKLQLAVRVAEHIWGQP